MSNKSDNTTAKSQIIVEFEANITLVDKHEYYTDAEIAHGDHQKIEDFVRNMIIDDSFNPIELVIDATVTEEPNRDRQIEIDNIHAVHDPNYDIPKWLYKYCEKHYWDKIVEAAQW